MRLNSTLSTLETLKDDSITQRDLCFLALYLLRLLSATVSKGKDGDALEVKYDKIGYHTLCLMNYPRNLDRCPRCKKPEETATHILLCNAPSATQLWEDELDRLKGWFRCHDTAPQIMNAVLHNLVKWKKVGGIFPHHYADNRTRTVIRDQNTIGWNHFMLGRFSYGWKILQDEYYKKIQSRRTGQRWAELLIKELWRIHWSMWDQRNKALHGTGNHAVLGTRELELNIKRELQMGARLLLPTERYLFNITMNTVKNWTAEKKKKWLDTVDAARYTSRLRHMETARSREIMQTWLDGS